MGQQKLFFALWPDDLVRKNLQALLQQVSSAGVCPIRAEDLHLTLVFMGYIKSQNIESITRAVEGVKVKPFVLNIEHTGTFPESAVLWAGPTGCPMPLAALVRSLRERLHRSFGYAAEKRKYTPHITLSRRAGRSAEHLSFQPFEWEVTRYCLIESTPKKSGSYYRILKWF